MFVFVVAHRHYKKKQKQTTKLASSECQQKKLFIFPIQRSKALFDNCKLSFIKFLTERDLTDIKTYFIIGVLLIVLRSKVL